MKKVSVVLVLLAAGLVPATEVRAREPTQEQLDAECEAARERKLAPQREHYIEECVRLGQQRDRAACERFYADHGAQAGGRAPLYYDLPECVRAFEHRQSSSRR